LNREGLEAEVVMELVEVLVPFARPDGDGRIRGLAELRISASKSSSSARVSEGPSRALCEASNDRSDVSGAVEREGRRTEKRWDNLA
jgi:hypothetical protein